MESNLNRSFSAPDITSEPICRRVFMEELYYSSNSPYPIRRQISYDHFPTQFSGQDFPSKYLPIKQEKFPEFSNYTPNRITKENIRFLEYPQHNGLIPNNTKYLEYQQKTTPKIEYSNNGTTVDHFNDSPMDIDVDDIHTRSKISTPIPTTTNETASNNCEINYRGVNSSTEQEEMAKKARGDLKKKFRRLTDNKKEEPQQEKKKSSIKLPVTVVVIIALALVPVYDHYNYNRIIDLEQIKTDLTESVINQNAQITQVLNFLNRINTDKNKHVLTFIGTTGVGKTHCANIIKRAFKPQQIHEISLENFNLKNLPLHREVPYLLILENLKLSDVDRVVLFLDALPINKSLLILNIFNIQETEDHKVYTTHEEHFTEIPRIFENSGYLIEAVKFNSFDKSVVKSYYDFLTKDNVVSEGVFLETVEEHNFEYFGLKKFFAKLNLS